MMTHGLVVPAYFHPATGGEHWAALAAGGGAVWAVVLNSSDGPGETPEAELTAAALSTGRPIYGYVDTNYGLRPVPDVELDLKRWWDGYPVSGIFLDRVATQPELLAHYAGLTRGIGGPVVFNHGSCPEHPGYADLADAFVTFEGTTAAHRVTEPAAWTADVGEARVWNLIYGTPPEEVAETIARAAARNVGGLFVTDGTGENPWDRLPPYFATLSESWIRTGSSQTGSSKQAPER